MRSANLTRIESLTWTTMMRGYRQLTGAGANVYEAVAAMLRTKRDERYEMAHEGQLRGPMSDEYRRAWWL